VIRQALDTLAGGKALTAAEARGVMEEVMEGKATPAQIAALLMGLRVKGETVEELVGFAWAMASHARSIRPRVKGRVVDLCGTGGAPFKTFNVSTISSFVVAAAGVPVAKHGNRSFTSSCGSADLLEALGVRIDLEPPEVEAVMERVGVCFMFAPRFHPAMAHVAPVRKEMGVRTVFNLLGPLTNPAGARGQLMGVYDPTLVGKLPEVMRGLGLERGMVVHGEIGCDEISTLGTTEVGELLDGEVKRYSLDPSALGLRPPRPEDIGNLDPRASTEVALAVLGGKPGPRADMVALNSAAGLYVGGAAVDLAEGLALAREALADGSALEKLRQLAEATGGRLP
jgi:anthranilate phosphoribosyltransferase